ncbi:MAG: preprotein translocase subunit SecE [Pseudomonadota bacterium]|nr:MAG: preprotein translocase subunit SecE [Pseudomonadota bacterium]
MADKIKFVLAGLLLVAGLAAFYYYSDLPLVARVGMVLAGVVAGVAVGLSSEPGKRLARFIGESREELRKVVWPTRKESFQTAAAVFGFVVLMAVFLWVVDKGLEFALYNLILDWKK